MISADFKPRQSAEILMSRIDASLAAEELGFEAQEPLPSGLAELLGSPEAGGS